MRLLQTLLAFITGAIAAIMWLERQTTPEGTRRAPTRAPATPTAAPEPERVVEEVVVPDPEQATRIEQLEAELAEQRAMRAPEPDDGHPGVDAIRAARLRTLELERELSRQRNTESPAWHEVAPPAIEELVDAAAEHLPRVALWVSPKTAEPGALWRALGAMQEFAEASGGAWFEFDGDFARWCRESGHPLALDPDQVGLDEERPEFRVEPRVNRSGQMATPNYVEATDIRLHYVDDVAGETGRMHVVGIGSAAGVEDVAGGGV